jgi:hypothetical protein
VYDGIGRVKEAEWSVIIINNQRISIMAFLRLQKRLAASVLKCG